MAAIPARDAGDLAGALVRKKISENPARNGTIDGADLVPAVLAVKHLGLGAKRQLRDDGICRARTLAKVDLCAGDIAEFRRQSLDRLCDRGSDDVRSREPWAFARGFAGL